MVAQQSARVGTRYSSRDPGGIAATASAWLTPEDFGATGDGLTYDDTAMSAFLADARENGRKEIHFTPNATYLLAQSLDFTGLSRCTINGHWAVIQSTERDYPQVDMVKSNNCLLRDLQIRGGSQGSPARRGLQLGLVDNVQPYSENTLENVRIDGSYSEAALVSQGCEVLRSIACEYVNRLDGGERYAVILDGSAHWPLLSRHQVISRPADTFVSFNSQAFYECVLYALGETGTGGAVWTSGSADHHFEGGYVQVLGARPAVTVYCAGTGSAMPRLRNFRWHVHTETDPSALIYFTGAADISVEGLEISDHLVQVRATTGTVFAVDPATVTGTVSFTGARLRLHRWSHASARMFDNTARYQMQGEVQIHSDCYANWNEPAAGFIGCTILTDAIASWTLVGSATELVAGNTKLSRLGRVFHGKTSGASLANGGTTNMSVSAGINRFEAAGGSIASHTLNLPAANSATNQDIAIVVRGTVSTLTVTAASGTVYSGITSASGVTRFTAHSDGAAWWVG